MSWLAAPALLAVLGLPGPALLCLAIVYVVRLARSLGPGAKAYIVVFLAVGILAG